MVAMTDLWEPPAPRKKPVQREWKEQETDARFLNHALPYDAYWTAIDGGRAKNGAIGQLRKRRGLKGGVPDWLIVWQGITLWIERKVSKAESDLNDNQRLTAAALVRNGHLWARANDTFEVEAALRAAGIPLRATYGVKPPAAPRNPSRPRKATPGRAASAGFVRRAANRGILV